MRGPTVVTPHAEYSPPRALEHSTSDQTSCSIDRKPLASVMSPAWGLLPLLVSVTSVEDSHSSGFSWISDVVSESSLGPVSSPEITTLASTWKPRTIHHIQ